MNVYLNLESMVWGHDRPNEKWVWGLQENAIPPVASTKNTLSFPMRKKNKCLGPLVGILTSKRNRRKFAGNRKTFRRIHFALKEKGGICFVFTPEGIDQNQINGYVYNELEKEWVAATFPIPNLVYNRIPYRKDEQSIDMKATFEWLQQHSIPYFNPHFFSKWDCYAILSKDQRIKPFLPKTFQILSKDQFLRKLKPNCCYYLKPNNGLKGNGILTITCKSTNEFIIKSHEKELILPSPIEVWNKVISPRIKKENYILQKKIELNKHQERPYDFRLHVQRLYNRWKLTGVGIRCSAKGGITTHVPKGGEVLTTDDISPPINFSLLEKVATLVAHRLEQKYGTLGEFSMDVGRDLDGNYWVFEINSKPMIFDEEDIQQLGLTFLLETFYSDTGFVTERSDTNANYQS